VLLHSNLQDQDYDNGITTLLGDNILITQIHLEQAFIVFSALVYISRTLGICIKIK